MYQIEQLLDHYRDILNAHDKIQLGKVENHTIIQSIERYYLYYFNIASDSEKMQKLVKEYLKGIIWIFEYYYNYQDDHLNWNYPYHRPPFLQDISKVLSTNKIDFSKIKLEKIKEKDFYTPFEQYLSISPISYQTRMDDEYIKLMDGLIDINLIKEFVTIAHQKFDEYYFSLDQIVSNIVNVKNVSQLDCQGAKYFNKCHLKLLKKDKKIDTFDFINEFRKLISYQDQMKLIN